MVIFVCYVDEDEVEKNELMTFFKPFLSQEGVEVWDRSMLKVGEDRNSQLKTRFNKSSCYLFLLSADSIANDDFVKSFEEAKSNRSKKKRSILPVYLKPCDLKSAPFSSITCIPQQPISILGDKGKQNVLLHFKNIITNKTTTKPNESRKSSNKNSRISSPTYEKDMSTVHPQLSSQPNGFDLIFLSDSIVLASIKIEELKGLDRSTPYFIDNLLDIVNEVKKGFFEVKKVADSCYGVWGNLSSQSSYLLTCCENIQGEIRRALLSVNERKAITNELRSLHMNNLIEHLSLIHNQLNKLI